MKNYTGEVIVKWSKARGSVIPLPDGRYSLKFPGSDVEYICNADDFEPLQGELACLAGQ